MEEILQNWKTVEEERDSIYPFLEIKAINNKIKLELEMFTFLLSVNHLQEILT